MDNGQTKVRETVKSSTLKCGKRTYFFDINLAKNEKKYLRVTESRFIEEGQERKRNSFVLFPEDVQNFRERLGETAGYLSE